MPEGQVYRCQNLHCGCEIKVLKTSTGANSNPRCCCGAEMKKLYASPVLRSLNSNIESLVSFMINRN